MNMIGPRPTHQNIPVEELLKRLEKGNICYGLKYKGEIAAFNWANLDECDNRFNPVKMKPNEAYLFDMHTMKPFRGKSLASYLRTRTFRALKEMGKDTFYSTHVSFNRSSIRFKQKINAKVLRSGLYIRLFKKFRWNVTLR